jgi:hypothetical protein
MIPTGSNRRFGGFEPSVQVLSALVWMGIWALVLRAFGIPVLMRTPEERTARKQRILHMGKLRYILIFGVLGSGIGLGLGIAMAFMTAHISANWREAVVTFAAVSVLGGCFNGMKAWSQPFRTEVPFPPIYPLYPPSK